MTADEGPVQDPTKMRAWRSPQAWAILLITVVICLPLDIVTKSWAFGTVAGNEVELDRDHVVGNPHADPVPRHQAREAIPGVLQYRLVINRGAVFGLGANQRLFFILFTVGALSGAIFMFGRMTTADAWIGHIAVGLVIAGGIGNLFDRVSYGAVRDFIHLLPGRELPFGWRWPGGNPELFPWVFNVADMLLLTGMMLFLMNMNRVRRPGEEETEAGLRLEA